MTTSTRSGLFISTPILPKPFEDKFMNRAVKEFMYDESEAIVKDLQKPIRKWKHKVIFDVQVTSFYFPLTLSMTIWTTDQPYIWVEGGTKKHMVKPKKAKALHWIDPVSGEDRFSKGHMVKGIRKRNWTFYVKRKWDKKLQADFQKLINVYAVRSGYAG